MNKEDLIKKCRYFNGSTSDNDNIFAYYESCWVKTMLENPQSLVGNVREYKFFGLEDFSPDDGVPIGIKAILFNRFMHWQGGYGTEESFKSWYVELYLNGSK